MKRIIIILAAMLLMFNFKAVSNDTANIKIEDKNIVQTHEKQKTPDANTGYTYELKGIKYPVYKTSRGKFYILKTSKKGNQYKMYITDKVSTLIK